MATDGWATYLEEHAPRFRHELLDFLRIPSVSSLPEHAADVRRAAEWTANRLEAAGLEQVRVLPTERHPVVYADWLHAPGKPTALIYGHLDVQPADPLGEWTTPPFEPTVRDGRVYARGASDMKGGVLLTIVAVEALLRTAGALPVNVKFFLEGEEEIGSPSAAAVLAADRDLFACDLVLIADGFQRAEDQGQIVLGRRGLVAVQIDVRTANSDLHSSFGGAAPNAVHALVELLGSMRRPDGHVLIRGFYDDIPLLSDADRTAIAAFPLDFEEMRVRWEAKQLVGEPGYTPQERVSARPTFEVNGVWGGFEGEGMKTVIPCQAHAKVTCRLVPSQEPDRVAQLIAEHVAEHTPAAAAATVTRYNEGARPYRLPLDHPANRVLAAALTELYGRPPLYFWGPGTVPVCDLFSTVLGAPALTFGFGLLDEQVHAPTEFFRLASFARGQRAYCMLLERLGEESSATLA